MTSKRSMNEDEPAPNGPADVGWTKKASAPKRGGGTSASAPTGKSYVAPQVADPNVTHGDFKVYQRTDGPFIVIDTTLPPGARTIATLPIKRVTGEESDAAHTRTLKAAEAWAKLCATGRRELGASRAALLALLQLRSEGDPHVLEERPAIDLLSPLVAATSGGEAAHG